MILAFLMFSCKEVDETELKKNRNILISHNWNLPQIIQGSSQSVYVFFYSPTIFNDNGTVFIGIDYEDFWELVNENTVRFFSAEIDWKILTINDSLLYISMYKMNSSEFIVECSYEAM